MKLVSSLFCSYFMLRTMATHAKCRNTFYPSSNIKRFPVNDNQVDWSFEYLDYNPPHYESPNLKSAPWADPAEIDELKPLWNEIDGKVNRKSHSAEYKIVGGKPQNPMGRTGIVGRGRLGRWGPNHAADPIVTRWKVDGNKERIFNEQTQKPILQFCAIQRRDNSEWAIPGGMLDPGEHVSQTLMREFMEEALNSLETSADKLAEEKKIVAELFEKGVEVHKGYVDDCRNTDNSWMETVASNFHDETGNLVGKLSFNAGDDAKAVRWVDIDKGERLVANHLSFICKVAQLRGAHF